MQVSYGFYGTRLVVNITVYDPISLQAIDPTVATASFYTIDGTGAFVAHPTFGPIALARIGAEVGFWGGTEVVGDVNTAALVMYITATVGGQDRIAVCDFGKKEFSSVPGIVITPGVTVDTEM